MYPPREADSASAGPDGAPPGARVLVVEDDLHTRRVLVLLLELRGYDVMETGEPREGIEWAGSMEVDLVISDLQLPQMSGIDMAERIARVDGCPPMVAITSGREALMREAIRSGHFQAVLRKPVEVNELLDLAARLTVAE